MHWQTRLGIVGHLPKTAVGVVFEREKTRQKQVEVLRQAKNSVGLFSSKDKKNCHGCEDVLQKSSVGGVVGFGIKKSLDTQKFGSNWETD